MPKMKRPLWLTILCVLGWIGAINTIFFQPLFSIALFVTIYWLWKIDRRGWAGTLVLETIIVLFIYVYMYPFTSLDMIILIGTILQLMISILVIVTLIIKRNLFSRK